MLAHGVTDEVVVHADSGVHAREGWVGASDAPADDSDEDVVRAEWTASADD